MDLGNVGGETKVFNHISMILWWMITVGNQSDAKVLLGLQLSGFKDVSTDGLDVLGCGGDVASLTSGAVLDEHKIPGQKENVKLSCAIGAITGGEGSYDDCKNGGLTTSSFHPAVVEAGCKRADSWRMSRRRNPCLRPCCKILKGGSYG